MSNKIPHLQILIGHTNLVYSANKLQGDGRKGKPLDWETLERHSKQGMHELYADFYIKPFKCKPHIYEEMEASENSLYIWQAEELTLDL